VQVLALENDDDVVPHLDGRSNPDQANLTTVSVHHGDGTIGNDHSLDGSYLPGAVDADASNDPSIRGFLGGASGFLTASQVRAETYVITRGN
jgi:hypothetical protein